MFAFDDFIFFCLQSSERGEVDQGQMKNGQR